MQGLIDTNILIDFMRGYAPAQKWLAGQTELGVSGIVQLELIAGAPNLVKQKDALTLLKDFALIKMANQDIIWAIRQLTQF